MLLIQLPILKVDRVAFNMNNKKSSEKSVKHLPHNFGNNYNDHYLHKGIFPQCFISNIDDPLVGYPKLRLLHKLKAEQNLKYAHTPLGLRVDANRMAPILSTWSKTVFDVVMIGSCVDEHQADLKTLMNLPIAKITTRPSVLFLWVSGSQLAAGRQAMEHWGFRRSEDIVYFCLSKDCVHLPRSESRSSTATSKSCWHCLMGLKGTLRRSDDNDLINCNVDTDLLFDNLLSRSKPGVVPDGIYSLIESFCLMTRRIHIIPNRTSSRMPVRPRPGWLIISPDIYLDNFTCDKYTKELDRFAKNNRVPLTQEIEHLRPKTPPSTQSNGKPASSCRK